MRPPIALRKKILIGASVAALGAAMAAQATAASAAALRPTIQPIYWRHGGGAAAAGIIGGLALGALAGAAGAYGGPYSYGPAYYGYGPGYYPDCYLARQHFWTAWGWRWRTVRVCN